jgi:hypothetical protein
VALNTISQQTIFFLGYTGFVPRSRGQLGMGYPIITQLALNEFTDDLIRVKSEPSDGKAAKEVSMGADGKTDISRGVGSGPPLHRTYSRYVHCM